MNRDTTDYNKNEGVFSMDKEFDINEDIFSAEAANDIAKGFDDEKMEQIEELSNEQVAKGLNDSIGEVGILMDPELYNFTPDGKDKFKSGLSELDNTQVRSDFNKGEKRRILASSVPKHYDSLASLAFAAGGTDHALSEVKYYHADKNVKMDRSELEKMLNGPVGTDIPQAVHILASPRLSGGKLYNYSMVTTEGRIFLPDHIMNRIKEVKEMSSDFRKEILDLWIKDYTADGSVVTDEIIKTVDSTISVAANVMNPKYKREVLLEWTKDDPDKVFDINKIIADEKKEDESLNKPGRGGDSAIYQWDDFTPDENSILDRIGLTYYKHVKTSGFYRKLHDGKNSNDCTKEKVVYKALQKTDYPKGQVWVRPRENFYYPGRFRKLTFKEILLLWFGFRNKIK